MRGTKVALDSILFKSKLEAMYWELLKTTGAIISYETVKLDGWYPDFEIETAQGEVLLAEVKPTSNEGALYAGTIFDIVKNNIDQVVLILSGNPCFQKWQRDFDQGVQRPELLAGYVYIPSNGDSTEAGEVFPLFLVRTRRGSWDFVHRGSFNTGLLTDEPVGRTYISPKDYEEFEDLMGDIKATVNKAARETKV